MNKTISDEKLDALILSCGIVPCPFCGNTTVEFQWGTEDREGTPVNLVCTECGACGPNQYINATKESDYVEIIQMWNMLTKSDKWWHSMISSKAPWDDEQLKKLKKRQSNKMYHPYTCWLCDNHIELIPTKDGWYCQKCNKVTQDWCYASDII